MTQRSSAFTLFGSDPFGCPPGNGVWRCQSPEAGVSPSLTELEVTLPDSSMTPLEDSGMHVGNVKLRPDLADLMFKPIWSSPAQSVSSEFNYPSVTRVRTVSREEVRERMLATTVARMTRVRMRMEQARLNLENLEMEARGVELIYQELLLRFEEEECDQ